MSTCKRERCNVCNKIWCSVHKVHYSRIVTCTNKVQHKACFDNSGLADAWANQANRICYNEKDLNGNYIEVPFCGICGHTCPPHNPECKISICPLCRAGYVHSLNCVVHICPAVNPDAPPGDGGSGGGDSGGTSGGGTSGGTSGNTTNNYNNSVTNNDNSVTNNDNSVTNNDNSVTNNNTTNNTVTNTNNSTNNTTNNVINNTTNTTNNVTDNSTHTTTNNVTDNSTHTTNNDNSTTTTTNNYNAETTNNYDNSTNNYDNSTNTYDNSIDNSTNTNIEEQTNNDYTFNNTGSGNQFNNTGSGSQYFNIGDPAGVILNDYKYNSDDSKKIGLPELEESTEKKELEGLKFSPSDYLSTYLREFQNPGKEWTFVLPLSTVYHSFEDVSINVNERLIDWVTIVRNSFGLMLFITFCLMWWNIVKTLFIWEKH